MTGPRRLSLQLTPLFDLMLIVIFAQYLSVRSDQMDRAEVTKQLQEQQQQSDAALTQAAAKQEVLGRLLVELFHVPESDVHAALAGAERGAANEQAALQQRFQELAEKNSVAAVEHVLTYEEIRKRCDIWSLHLDAAGVVTLQTTAAPPVPILDVSTDNVSLDRLGAELFARYKEIPEQKSLVLILLTYERGTRIQLTRQLRTLLPQVTAQMQADSGGRSRYDFADMGFRDL